MSKIPDNIINNILNDEDLLLRKLAEYESVPVHRQKNKYSCVHDNCSSSDGLSVKNKGEGYFFKCFSCGNGGNAITLVMNKENLEYRQAIELIANKEGIEIPNKEYTPEQKAKHEQIKKSKEELEQFKAIKLSHLNNVYDEALKNGDINRAFNIDCGKDYLKGLSFTETINHTKYKANETYYIDQYISDKPEGLQKALQLAGEGKKVLVISQTGSGKTDTTIKTIKPNELYKAIFISPNASNVEQIMQKYKIDGAFGTDLNGDIALQNTNIACMTWDKFAQLKDTDLSKYVAILDEAHQTYTDMYRKEKIKGLYKNMDKCKGQLHITATVNKLDIESFDYIVEYIPKKQTDYNVKLYDNISDSKVIEIMNKSKKFLLLENNTKNLEYYQQSINKKTDIITSDKKETSKTYYSIMKDGTIGDYEGILTTSVIVAGVNIYDPDITDIIVIGEKDLSVLKQFPARPRELEECNIHIFNTYKDFNKTYSIEWLVNEEIKATQMLADSANIRNKFRQETLSLKMTKLDDENNVYYDDETREYKVDIQKVRHEIYTSYYNNADIISFRELLKEYYPCISIVKVEEDKSRAKKLFKELVNYEESEAKAILKENKNILVGAIEILKDKLSSNLSKYLTDNNLRESNLLEQYNDKDIKSLLNIGKNKKFIELYSKYVLENNFTYDLAWLVSDLSPNKRQYLFNSLNKIVYRRVFKDYPQLEDSTLLENRIYNLLIREFTNGIIYNEEHIKEFLETLKIVIPEVNISSKKIAQELKENYVIECKNSKFGTGLTTNLYKNIVPNGVPEGKKIRLYTINSEKTVEDIAEEFGLNEIDTKVLNDIVDRRYNKIIESEEAKRLLDINKIFAC